MPIAATLKRKRPVNLTLSVGLLAQAKTYTNNLSETIEALLAEFVAQQKLAQHDHKRVTDICVSDWNAVNARIGSFADEHVNL